MPIDFYEMTCKDIGTFCLAMQKKEKENAIVNASIMYRISEKILNGLSMKPKQISFKELFSDIIDNYENTMAENKKESLIIQKWKDFLKG